MFDALGDKLQSALGDLRGRGVLDEESISRAMREVRLALLEADVNLDVVKDFVAHVRERALGEAVRKSLTPGQEVVKIVHDELTKLLGGGLQASAAEPPTRGQDLGSPRASRATRASRSHRSRPRRSCSQASRAPARRRPRRSSRGFCARRARSRLSSRPISSVPPRSSSSNN